LTLIDFIETSTLHLKSGGAWPIVMTFSTWSSVCIGLALHEQPQHSQWKVAIPW